MPIYRGSTLVDAVYRGATPVDRVYRGSTLVWAAEVLSAPARTTAAAIPGGAWSVGQARTATAGVWTGNPTPTITRRWQRRLNGGVTWTVISGATGLAYTPVAGDVGYDMRLQEQGSNTEGTSAWLNSNIILDVQPAATVPAQPATPTFSAIGTDTATVTWAAPADGGSPITSYTLEWRETGGATTTITGATSPHVIGSLTADTAHEARVTAINAIGPSTPSAWGTFSTDAAGPTPIMAFDATTYTGPAWDNPLPAAVGGVRTIVAADPAPHTAPLTITGAPVYVIWRAAAPVTLASNGAIANFNICEGGYAGSPWFRFQMFGWSASYEARVDGTVVSVGPINYGVMETVEMWIDAGVITLVLNGGTPVTVAYTPASWTNATVHFMRDEGSGGQSVGFEELRVYDTIPTTAGSGVMP